MKVPWFLPEQSEIVNSSQTLRLTQPSLGWAQIPSHYVSQKEFLPLLEDAQWEGLRPPKSP